MHTMSSEVGTFSLFPVKGLKADGNHHFALIYQLKPFWNEKQGRQT